MKQTVIRCGIVGLVAGVGRGYLQHHFDVDEQRISNSEVSQSDTRENAFLADGLATDTSQSSIDLSMVLDGGPGKDGIRAIDDPNFLTLPQASGKAHLRAEGLGIVVVADDIAKFYPYSILNRHEIVNDTIKGKHIAVTFCPLCGSAIVFDREIAGRVIKFGVSGKLYNSNLLMYDDATESLWSQAMGKSVVGALLDTKLERVDSDVMNWEQFQEMYPDGLVLSDETDFPQNYTWAPYGDYDENDRLFFPVSNTDARLPKKELLYVVNYGNQSLAFVRSALVEAGMASIEIEGQIFTATYEDGMIAVMSGDEKIPGFHEMRFSRVTHNPNSLSIWTGEQQ